VNAGFTASTANRIGVSVNEYRARREAGERWCWACRDWHPAAAFGWRSDALGRQFWRVMSSCVDGNRAASRAGMARLRARRRAGWT
jgi:hypothetical protein